MKVYLIVEYDFEYCKVDSVYVLEEDAKKRVERLRKQFKDIKGRTFHILRKSLKGDYVVIPTVKTEKEEKIPYRCIYGEYLSNL